MRRLFNRLLDNLSEALSKRKGLLPLLGIVLVILNFFVLILAPNTWLGESMLLLHLGVITSLLGILIAWAI